MVAAHIGEVFGDDDETRQFAERYFRVQHTDLLFANAALFVEGVAERMLVPLFMELKFEKLNSRYVSFVDIGGSHAHRLKPLIEKLRIPTVVITDIDPTEKKAGPKGKNRWIATANTGQAGLRCGNATLREWHPKLQNVDELKAPSLAQLIWAGPQDCKVRFAWQLPVAEAGDQWPTTFEDSLILTNVNWFNDLNKLVEEAEARGENTGPSSARLVLCDLAQIAACVSADGLINEFAATEVLRRAGCLDQLSTDAEQRIARTEEMREALAAFGAACVKPATTVAEVIAPIINAQVFKVDARLLDQFADSTPPPPAPIPRRETETDEARRRRGWCALFKAPWAELERYRRYLAGSSELATHQVVKGSEFTHVMVVMDDEESGGNQIAYDKLFGATELSVNDLKNVKIGKETTIDRSLRLLYVTCSRARESLALVLWAKNPAEALKFAREKSGWFEAEEVLEIA